MSGTSTHREKEAFFGGDGRARLYTKLFFFPQGNYSQVLNNGNANSILNTDAWSVMSAANYENQNVMGNNDIHWAFTDFIINAALFHREIDKNTKAGSYAEQLTDSVDKALYEYFNDQNIDLKKMASFDIKARQPAIVNPNNQSLPLQNILPTLFSNLEALIAILVSIGANKPQGSLDLSTNLNFSPPYGPHTYNDFINSFVDNGTLVDSIFSDPDVSNNLKVILSSTGNKLAKSQLIADIKGKLPSVLFNIFSYVINEANRRGILNEKNVYDFFSTNFNKLQMIEKITQVFKSSINDFINKNFGMNYTTADNKYVEQFINQVYNNWDNMSEDSKNFYRTVIRLFKYNNGTWEEVGEDELKNAMVTKNKYRINLRKKSPGDPTPYFWYLIPEIPSNVEKIFFTDKMGKKIYYDISQDTFGIKSFNGGANNKNYNQMGGATSSENILRRMYMAIYKNANTDFTDSLPPKFDPSLVRSEFPGLWIDKIVRNRLFQINQSSQKKQTANQPPQYNDEVFDFITQNVWKRSGDTLYMIKNGEKIIHDPNDKKFQELLTSSNNCFTTGSFNDKENCRAFMNECLLDHDPKNIMKCISVMENKDFALSAKKEISNMAPVAALNLLKKFGFRTYKIFDTVANGEIMKVEDVSHWLRTYMKKIFNNDTKAQSAIEGNDKILQYLNLVVEYVNANPGILNQNYSGSTEEKVGKMKSNSYAEKLGIPLRKDNAYKPELSINLLDASLRSNNIYGAQYRNPFVSPTSQLENINPQFKSPFVNLVSPFNNVNMVSTLLLPQSGGRYNGNQIPENFTSGAYVSEAIIFNLLEKLRQRNKVLDPTFVSKIEQKLESMKKTEKNMEINIRYIAEYIKLLDAFGDNKSEILSEGNLKDMVNSNYNLHKKHNNEEQSILQILKTLAKLAGEDEYGSGDDNVYKEIDTSILFKK